MDNAQLKQQLVDEVEKRKDELIELCSSLIRIPSENPPGDSTEASEFVSDYLKQFGLEVDWHEASEKMYNLVSSFGDESGKKLIYCGHTDVVPAGDLSKWDFDPFSGEVVDGWMLGRGASDMKGGLAGIIFAFTLFKRLGIELPGQLTLAIVPDEETGGEYGVPWLLENKLIDGDGCLIAEPSSPLNPTIGQKGSYWFELEVFGEPGHGSLSPVAGNNAIVDAIAAIEKIRTLWDLEIHMPEEVRELVEISKRYLREVEEEREIFQPVLERITVNIGTINGGTKSNVIPESCKVQVDCRLPFGITHEEVSDYLKKELDSLGIRYSIRLFGFKSVANYTSAQDPVCKAIVENIEFVTKEEAYGVMQWASSDARHFRDYHIPVLQYGPAYLPSIHGYNEKVLVEDIVRCAKVYVAAVVDFLYETSND
ncbi:M20 family metallopeptidase [Psychrobacillus lasiicapitis]|uniref:Probable succinyl-diaminopimelate desuccinylase n=1 Tax=Psychrobacillus lasiicapitis TaxID=1636719 RepID=A0A544T382_9BACI|nr:ArgE/DapE family deacylase [Psychrobacillus lasiicapitis]TQR11895.1 M20 family metallopeptidase [Psychrobacillus lasiicapitis]GGA20302.1 peptidase [Psychrobacillus lasiicapitis]